MERQKKENQFMRVLGIFMILMSIAGSIWFFMKISKEKTESSPLDPDSIVFPSAVPTGVPLFRTPVEPGEQVFLIRYGDKKVRVEFDPMSSIKRLWSGSNAKLVIKSPYSSSFTGETESNDWGLMLVTQGYSLHEFMPWMSVSFQIDEKYLHQWIEADAKLDVTYPVFSTTGLGTGFVNETASVEHALRFFIISPEEYEMIRALSEKPRVPDNVTPFVLAGGCLLLPGILFVLLSSNKKRY